MSETASETAVMVACGDIGVRFAAGLDRGHFRCVGLRRSPQQLPSWLEPVPADITDPASLRVLESLAPDILLFTPTPTERSTAGYRQGFEVAARNIVQALGSHRPAVVFMISSTRVYTEQDGAWVREGAALSSDDAAAQAIVAAEDTFIDALPTATVLRAGGLYGDGPGYLLRRIVAGELSPAEPLRFGNRIHRDDLTGFMHFLLGRERRERIYNVVDDAPVAQQEVERWLSEQLGVPYQPPAAVPGQGRGHKRISNQRMRDTGYELRYPDYRAGYGEVLRDARRSQGENGLDFD